MKPEEILELVTQAEALRLVIENVAKSLEGCGPTLRGLFGKMTLAMVDMRADAVAHLEAKGFTRPEAIEMTMDEWGAIRRSLNQRKGK